jgi:hypothetical protein
MAYIFYGHQYGLYWCLLKFSKLQSNRETVSQNMQSVKGYGQNKCAPKIIVFFFVFWPRFVQTGVSKKGKTP